MSFLEESFSQYQKLIENSHVVTKEVKDKLTLLDAGNDVGTIESVSTSSTPLTLEQITQENTENEQIVV